MALGPKMPLLHRDTDREVQAVAEATRARVRQEKVRPSSQDGDSVELTGLSIAGGDTKFFSHSLKRVPRGSMTFSVTTAPGALVYEVARSATTVQYVNPGGNTAKFSLLIF